MSLAGALGREEEKLLNCVHCGFCLPACPTYTRLGDENDSPRGRLYLMRAVVEGRLDPASEAFQDHIDRCLGCRACEPVCPSGVEYGHLLERAREAAAEAGDPGLLTRVLLGVMGRDGARGAFMVIARLLRASGIPGLAARFLPGWRWLGPLRTGAGMLAASADRVPDATSPPPSSTAEAGLPGVGEAAPGNGDGRRRHEEKDRGDSGRDPAVGMLEGCVQAGLFGRVNRATARVLQANGYRVVEVRGQGCCGALHAHAGALEGARALARRNVEAFSRAGVARIAVNAAGCGAAMKEYGELLADDPALSEEAEALSARVADVSELLAEAGPLRGDPLPLTVAYDAPCHLLHAQGTERPPLAVLEAIPGLRLAPLENADECCGGAGIYGITHPELGGRIGGDKVRAIRSSGAAVVATGNPGCIMQIGARARIAGAEMRVVHPVQLLDESYRLGGLYS